MSTKRIQAFLDQHKPKWIIGIDEVAYGSFAGSLFVGLFVAPAFAEFNVKDSKAYTTRKSLDEAAERLLNTKYKNLCFASSAGYLSEVGLAQALDESVHSLLELMEISVHNAVVILDGNRQVLHKGHIPILSVPKADVLVAAVSAASIIAKHNQLKEMDQLHAQYPEYGFHSHHGYGTPEHKRAIKLHGITPQHRRYIEFNREHAAQEKI